MNIKLIASFSLIIIFLIFLSFSSFANDNKKREKNMKKMTKITIKIDRIFKSEDIDYDRLIRIGNQLMKLGIEFPDYSRPDSEKGTSKSSMWTERELFLKMNQDFVDSVEDFVNVAKQNNRENTWDKFKVVFNECQNCHHKFARAKINLLED
ncbi:MAG: hypothetical protein CFH21_01119 [Alphaproteobacteria bacterium MarineAlpha5_Bin11]|nr:MAG: hypothetical protein CFH21_01119 [Alphaproteobacteria bacterium MarineAlpha5_Bin11]|tara:strand:- start:400 stop:855 length:456 start_codon:yes stop_codon:yes gene_type:complete